MSVDFISQETYHQGLSVHMFLMEILWHVSTTLLCIIMQDVEANTVRLEEHGKVVLVLEKSSGQESPLQGGSGSSSK